MEKLMDKKEYQKRINQLRQRNGELKGQYTKTTMARNAAYKKVEALQIQISDLNERNVELSQRVEENIVNTNKALTFEKSLARDIENLEMSHVGIQNRYNEKVNELMQLEDKLEQLQKRKDKLLLDNQEVARAQVAIKVRKSNVKQQILNLDQELKMYEQRLNKEEVDPILNLRATLKRHAGKDEASAAMVLTLVDSIINTMKENEFENLNYKYKVNSNDKKIGIRVQFQNVASYHEDIKERIYPIMKSYRPFINEMGIELKTKIVKSNNGMINVLDVAVVSPREELKETHQAPRASM